MIGKALLIAIFSITAVGALVSEREAREREKKEDIERFRDSYIGI